MRHSSHNPIQLSFNGALSQIRCMTSSGPQTKTTYTTNLRHQKDSLYTSSIKRMFESNGKRCSPTPLRAFEYLEMHCGAYPYTQYSIIQGGDGGMEYPMATLITGNRNLRSLIDVMVHEVAHSWYQGLLATNESLYAWMDEGFTTDIAEKCVRAIWERADDPLSSAHKSYKYVVSTGKEEPMSRMADHFQTNLAYSVASYGKGAVFQRQLSYIVGEEAFKRGMLLYFDKWKYRHPEPADYIRVMERASGMELDWYYSYYVESTETIGYVIDTVYATQEGTKVCLARRGAMPMPIDLLLTRKDGTQVMYYIPLRIMWGEKEKESNLSRSVMSPWPWTHPYYTFDVPESIDLIKRIEIDPSGRLANLGEERLSYPFSASSERPSSYEGDLSMKGKVLRRD